MTKQKGAEIENGGGRRKSSCCSENSHLYNERTRLISTRHSSITILESHCHSGQLTVPDNKARNTLLLAAAVCLLFTIGEAAGGYLANSMAIMTDAFHMLSDFAAYLISLFAIYIAKRPATQKMSFGWHRMEVMGAVISVLIIWVLTGILVYLAILRVINQDYTIEVNTMLITASCGVCVNIFMGFLLHQGQNGYTSNEEVDQSRGSSSPDGVPKSAVNINVRAAFIHVLGDLVQSVGVLIAAIVIKLKPTWIIADPICTFMFSILVLFTTLTILRDAIHVLMEGFPRDVSYPGLVDDLMKVPGVQTMHSLNMWSLTVDKNAVSVHLAIDHDTNNEETLVAATTMLREKYDVFQSTIQVEQYQPAMENCMHCKTPRV